MGMFDYLKCQYPLPGNPSPDEEYQTKDTENQFLLNYEIREDGTLWFETFDYSWAEGKPGSTNILEALGTMHRSNPRWEQEVVTGEIVFYGDSGTYSAYFVDGKLDQVHRTGEGV